MSRRLAAPLPLLVVLLALGLSVACVGRGGLDPEAARIVIFYDASAAPEDARISRLHVWRSANPNGPFVCMTESAPVPAPVTGASSAVYVDRAVRTGETWYYYIEAERLDGTWAKVTRTVPARAVVLDVTDRQVR